MPNRGDDRYWGSDEPRARSFGDVIRVAEPSMSSPFHGVGPRRRDAIRTKQLKFEERGSGCGAPSWLIRRPCSVALGATAELLSFAGTVCSTPAATGLMTRAMMMVMMMAMVMTMTGRVSVMYRLSIDAPPHSFGGPETGMTSVR